MRYNFIPILMFTFLCLQGCGEQNVINKWTNTDKPEELAFPFPPETRLIRPPSANRVFPDGIEFSVPERTPLLVPVDGILDHVYITNEKYPIQGEVFTIHNNQTGYMLDMYVKEGSLKASAEGRWVKKGEIIGWAGKLHSEKATNTPSNVIIKYRSVNGERVNLSQKGRWESSIQW